MTVLDAGIIAVVVFFVAWGAWVGFIRQLALVVALVAGFVVAGLYAAELRQLAAPLITSPRLAFIISYLLLLAAAYLVVRLAIPGLRRVVTFSLVNWFDRGLGGVFGLAKAYLLLVLFYLAFSGVSTAITPLLQNSYFSPWLATGADCLQTLVRDQQLREQLTPREPAIKVTTPVPGSAPR